MNKMKTVAIWFLFALAMFAVVACSGDEGEPTGGDGAATEAGSPDDAGGNAEAPKEKTVYTMGVGDNKLSWGGPITEALTEKTGVELKYDIIVGDIFQKWDLWLAAGDYPDIIRLDAEHLQKYIDAGAVIPLNELIDEYGPNIKEKWGDDLELLRHDDGNIYSLYAVNKAEEAPANAKAGFVVQYAVLEEAGFPNIRTLDQLYEVVKAYRENHPELNGQQTIGFGAAMNSWTINIFFNNPAVAASGRPDHGNFLVEESGDVRWNPVSAESKQYLSFLNKLYVDGLLDKEVFSMGEQELKEKMAQGRVLAAYAPAWFSNEPEAALRAAGQLERQYAHIPLYFDESVQDRSNALTPANGGTHEWAITTKAKNPENIIKFIDFLFSDEGQILTQWGIPGVHYELKDGKRAQTETWLQQKIADPDAVYKEGFRSEGTGGTSNWFSVGDGATLGDGDYATPVTKESVRKDYDEKTLEVLGKYGLDTWADLLPPVEKVPGYLWQIQPPNDTAFKVTDQKLDDLRRMSTPKIVMAATPEEFEREFRSFVAEAERLGLKAFETQYSEVWKAYVESYNANMKP